MQSTRPPEEKPMTDSELEAGLKELEEYENAVDQDPEGSFSETKKTQFLNEIHKISGISTHSKPGSVIPLVPVSYTPLQKPNIDEIVDKERKYHGIKYFIGDCLKNEIEHFIPKLEAELKRNPGHVGLREIYEEKRNNFPRFRERLDEMRKNGGMPPDKYVGALRKVLVENEQLHQQLVTEKKDEETIVRVWDRIDTIKSEIARFEPQKPQLSANLNMTNAIRKNVGGPATDNFFDAPVPPKVTPSVIPNNQNFFEPPNGLTEKSVRTGTQPVLVQQEKISVTTDRLSVPGGPAPAMGGSSLLVAFICYKIDCRKSLKRYLEEHFADKRADEIQRLGHEMAKLGELRDMAMNNPGKLTPEKIDAVFPELTTVDIIGQDKKQMEENFKKISEIIAAESKSIKNAKIAEAFTNHYRNFFVEMNTVLKTPNTPMPKIERQTIEVPCNDVNTHIKKGNLVVQLKGVKQSGEANTFRVVIDFQYDNRSFNKDFGYNSKAGAYNKEFTFELDKDKILKKFAKSNLFFTVYKKHIFSDALVGKASVPLTKLERSLLMPFEFELDWNGKKLAFNGEVHVNKALDQPMKEVKVFGIEKRYPPWTPPKKMSVNDMRSNIGPIPSQAPTPQVQPSNYQAQKPSQPPQGSTNPVQPRPNPTPTPAPTPAPAPAPTSATDFKSNYKYPIMSVDTKNKLKAILAKNKLDVSTADYEMASFCVGFLTTLEEESEKQINDFLEVADTESRKATTDLMMKAIQYKNYIENSMDNGKMTLPDYIKKLEDFIKLDDAYLATLGKLKHAQGIYYINNRKKAIAEELKMLKEQAG